MTTNPKRQATIEDLYNVPENGKAEIVNGELVLMSPTGFMPNFAAGCIYASLLQYRGERGGGYPLTDNAGFVINLPNRRSFSPDAAWFAGDLSRTGMKFIDGAPAFAVEVRSDGDYGPKAERAITAKIADYFAAGTIVVWDVDLLHDDIIKVYRAGDPTNPTIYRRGDIAEAEPAVPGWTFSVDEMFA